MLAVLSSVVVISFSGVMLPGPMFAIVLAKSYKSPLAGTQMALGHAVIEVPLIMLIYFGVARFFEHIAVQVALSLAGGAMIAWMGVGMLRARNTKTGVGRDLPYSALTAGILTTALNPFFLLWWASIGSLLIMKFYEFGGAGIAIFAVVHWLCDLVWLSFLSVTVHKTHTFWGQRFQGWVFTGCGLLLLGFGAWFIYSGVKLVL